MSAYVLPPPSIALPSFNAILSEPLPSLPSFPDQTLKLIQLPSDSGNQQQYIFKQLYEMWEEVMEEGETYPQCEAPNPDSFRAYYYSHHAFAVILEETQELIGAFYIKPNFPGRSSHICNGGFLVPTRHRRKGVGNLLALLYERLAPLLGFKASFFNLVYANNEPSRRLWEKRGYTLTGTVPKAGFMKKSGLVDAFQFYKEFNVEEKPDQ